MSAIKIRCTVNGIEGLFHLQEHDLVPAATFGNRVLPSLTLWGGIVDVSCAANPGIDLLAEDLLLELEDGRQGHARVLVLESQGENVETTLIYVVGLNRLEKPRAPSLQNAAA